jgi:hypothetical protein
MKQTQREIQKMKNLNETPEQKQLRKQRRQLADNDYNTYSPDDFPGSKRWNEHNAAEKALRAFDAAHPEVKAALQAKKDAKASKRLNADIWND